MKNYNVFFTIYGKKLKVAVDATCERHAIDIVHKALIIHKIEEKKANDDIEYLKNIFNFT